MKQSIWLSAAATLALSGMAAADAPRLQTKGTVIHLADNLDEADNLGWCIDTLGRGWSEQLQTHSCKPQGGDVQFGFRAEAQQIFSVEFDGKCMALVDSGNAKVPFGLIDCDPASAAQQFGFDASTGRFFRADTPEECVIVGESSRSAGPFMSRDLTLGDCKTTDPNLSTWMIKSG